MHDPKTNCGRPSTDPRIPHPLRTRPRRSNPTCASSRQKKPAALSLSIFLSPPLRTQVLAGSVSSPSQHRMCLLHLLTAPAMPARRVTTRSFLRTRTSSDLHRPMLTQCGKPLGHIHRPCLNPTLPRSLKVITRRKPMTLCLQRSSITGSITSTRLAARARSLHCRPPHHLFTSILLVH